MSAEENLPQDLRAMEARLAALRPGTGRFDRDRLFYLAGRASAGGRVERTRFTARRWAWPAVAAVLGGLAAALSVMLVNRPATQIVERIVEVQVQPPVADHERGPATVAHDQPAPAGENRPDDASSPDRALLSSMQAAWASSSAWAAIRYRADQSRLRDEILSPGRDKWRQPHRATDEERASQEPDSYRELLNSMLDGASPKQSSPRPGAGAIPHLLGVHS